ncbi:hypothetical protein NHX12_026806 [Muraenolepis orangiensis]|uniref:Endonuclease/exonuclease/phosphatase domain-containing protein n=1 Tax=Muraenolepis orangiensis TaxID=630683 RepID=A0A9Q0I4G7_9TELE|nr:hypothetical protein NHX12_026806 [Muraenolepis orangiensis]
MVKVASLNANGLREYWRRQQALCVCEADIICLQETHWDDSMVEDVRREWLGDVFVSQGEAKARGVAILVKQGVVEGVKMVANDGRGRLVGGRLDIAVGMMWRSDSSRRELEGAMSVGGMGAAGVSQPTGGVRGRHIVQ